MDCERTHHKKERAFSLIEVMLASGIMAAGLLAIAFAFAVDLAIMTTAQEDSIAKQKARQAMEDVFTARDTGGISFSQICNIGNGPSCLFITGFEPLYTAGPDELVNTADDGTGPLINGCNATPCIETVDLPGPDGILGTADDVFQPLVGFQRSIQITSLSSVLNQITVTVQYKAPNGLTRTVTLIALIGPYV